MTAATASEKGLNGVATDNVMSPIVVYHGPTYCAHQAASTQMPAVATRPMAVRFCHDLESADSVAPLADAGNERQAATAPAIARGTVVRPGNICRSGPFSDEVHPHRATSGDAVRNDVRSALSRMMSL